MTPRSGQRIPNAGSSYRTPRASLGRIERRSQVVDLGIVLQRLTAVGAAFRYVQHPAVVGAQAGPVPATDRSAMSGRRSTTTSNTAPRVQRTSLASSAGAT